MNKSFFSRIFGGSETSEEDVAPDEALGEEAKNKSKIGSLFSRSKKTPGVVKKVGANSTSVRGAQYPPPTDDVPASFPEDMRESLGSSPPGGFSMSSSCGGIETGEIHNSTPPEQEEEVASLDRSAERLKIDPFGAVKPLEKQKSGNDLGRQSFDSPNPEDDPSSPGSPKASWAPQGLGDRLLDPSSTGTKVNKFQRLMSQPTVDLTQLRRIAWSGCPSEFRVTAWQLLLGYLPVNSDRRHGTLERKRREYLDFVPQYFEAGACERTEYEQGVYRQIKVDCPRTSPNVALFQDPIAQEALLRVLYIWAIRHPGSGYVQGINDLLTPFFVVFLTPYVDDITSCNLAELPPGVVQVVEADAYWCLTKLLDGIQDHYTFAQPGIQRMVFELKNLMRRINKQLHDHLEEQGLMFIQFTFRWMNCLLMRELPLEHIVRLWDTYLSEEDGFSKFHVYVCAAFLEHWADELLTLDFQELVIYLQHLPTGEWGAGELDTLLSKAFVLKHQFEGAQSHLLSQEAEE